MTSLCMRKMTMSILDEVHTEPMHDHPAEKDQLAAAMEAAGYVLDTAESTEDNLRFFGANGNVMTVGGWHECEEWLNGVVFDDPQVSDRVEIILHPERFLNVIRKELPFVPWRMQWSRTTTTLTVSSITCHSRTPLKFFWIKQEKHNNLQSGSLF